MVSEHSLDRTLVQQAKSARRRLAARNGIDLAAERVSLWRSRNTQDFEHLASPRSIYQGCPLAETFACDLFLFDALAGDVLTFGAGPAGEGQ